MIKLQTQRVNELGELYFCAMYHVDSHWDIATVGDKAARKILSATGDNLKGYRIRLYTTELKHLLNRHFTEGEKDLIAIKMQDVENIGSIVNECQTVTKGRGTQHRVHFAKAIPAGTAHFIAEIRPRERVLAGITLWIQRR